MEGGDLSNELPPRWLVVFEGVLGKHHREADRVQYEFFLKLRAGRRALDTFHVDNHAVKVLWDLTWRRRMKFDAVTFLPERVADRLEDWLNERNVPVSKVLWYSDPVALAEQLAYLPDVHSVIHADPMRRFVYGNRGVLVEGAWSV